ncbi:MAG: pyridoxal-phosphate-dependent aminotransferase family protein, partial [Akkermansiaceae bacterium]
MSSPKLFNPGPVDVSPETFTAMSHTMIGHRGKDFEDLYASLQPGLKEIFGTTRPVFLSTSSAWGVMEGALRNLAKKKVLCLCCGAFSDKWLDVAKKCGFEAEAVQVEWGQAISPDAVRAKLSEGGFDTVTFIHSETSTGVLNDLAGIAAAVKSFPDTMLIVDTVSSLSTVDINMDKHGIDVCLAGVQKALALPPGLALFAVSETGMERAKANSNRGYYFDFIEFAKNDAVN